jgi:hypothetical protein
MLNAPGLVPARTASGCDGTSAVAPVFFTVNDWDTLPFGATEPKLKVDGVIETELLPMLRVMGPTFVAGA